VQAVTQQQAPSSVNTQKTAAEQAANVKASKATTKMTTAEKNKAIKDANKQMVNPDNPSGSVAGTAAQQKANVEVSKGEPRQKQTINTLGPKDTHQVSPLLRATKAGCTRPAFSFCAYRWTILLS
jgi:hypothetical protein